MFAALLSGCASTRPSDESLRGRLSVQVAAVEAAPSRSVSAAFVLSGDAVVGRLDLNTPLGTTLARASWAPGYVELTTPQGTTSHASLGDMTRAVVGEALPLEAMFDWLHGRPWSGAPSRTNTPPSNAGFEQMGWRVDLSRFDAGSLGARRDSPPVVAIQVRLDRP
jgi:outer membrane lipoprotein LolB